MKRLMFAVPAMAAACLVGGCYTVLKDPKTNQPIQGPNGDYVKVSDGAAAQIRALAAQVVSEIKATVRRLPIKEQLVFKTDYDSIRLWVVKIAPGRLSSDEIEAITVCAWNEIRQYMNDEVYPALAEKIITGANTKVEKLIAEKKFAEARELLWVAPTTGCTPVDVPVRKAMTETMRLKVNPKNWEVIEKEITAKVGGFKAKKDYEGALVWLSAYPRVRTYSIQLDKQLKYVADSLVKLGVDQKNLDPILLATGELVEAAARIYDDTDNLKEEKTSYEKDAAVNPDLAEYELRLKEYEETLVKFDCTPEDAKRIAKEFDAKIRPLLKSFYKDANFGEETVSVLHLGTAGLNKRIKALCETNADAIKKIVYQTEVDDIEKRVRALTAAGQYEEARDLIWKSTSTENETKNSFVRASVGHLMIDLVNPTHWAAIEKQFDDNLARVDKKGEFAEALAWLEGVPLIRTYNERIDARLAEVKAELLRLGADEKTVEKAVSATAKAAALVENLVGNVDRMVAPNGGKTIADVAAPDRQKYEELLKAYWLELVRNDCLKANADKLVEDFRAMVESSLAVPAGQSRAEVLQLGCNALNARIQQRRAADTERVLVAKYRAETAALVEKGDFDGAREYVWKIGKNPDPAVEARMLPVKRQLIAEVINPANWKAIEKAFADKVAECLKTADFAGTLEWIHAYPHVRTYSFAFDDCIDAMAAELVAADAPAEKVDPVKAAARTFLTRLFEDKTIDAALEKVSLEKYDAAVAEFRETLKVYGCEDAQIESVIADWAMNTDAIVKGLVVTVEKRLGTTVLNERIDELKKTDEAVLIAAWTDDAANKLTMSVRASVRAKKFADARKAVREVVLIGDIDHDRALYAVRMGLLDAIVNPAQCDFMLKDMKAQVKAFVKADDYKGAKDYLEKYPYIRDKYEDIAKSLDEVKDTLAKMEVDDDASKAAVADAEKLIQLALDARGGVYVSKVPTAADLDASLKKLDDAVYAQLVGGNTKLTAEVRKMLERLITDYRNMTTEQVNAALKAEADTLLADVIEREKKYLAEVDEKAFSIDTQVAMAEDAIAKQLGIVCPKAQMQFNMVLGDYARYMRMLKMKQELTAEEATTLLVGAVYLNQQDAFARALKLGAKAEGTAARDPLARTPMLVAIQTGHLDFIDPILAAGGTFAGVDAEGNTAMHYAVALGNRMAIIKSLAGAKPTTANKAGETPLFTAVRKNQGGIAAIVIEQVAKDDRKAFVNMRNAAGETAFDVARACAARDALDPLASAGASFGVKHLAAAAVADQKAVAEWLIEHGVDVNGEGVMAAGFKAALELGRAGKKWPTYCYLVHEGGIGDNVQNALDAEAAAKAAAEALKTTAEESEKKGYDKGYAEGEAAAKNAPVEVILPKEDSVVIKGGYVIGK